MSDSKYAVLNKRSHCNRLAIDNLVWKRCCWGNFKRYWTLGY